MQRRPPSATLTDTLVPSTALFRSRTAARVDSTQHPAGFTVDNGHLSSDTAANVQRAVVVRFGCDEPSVLSAPDLAFLRQPGQNLESPERSEEHTSELQSLMRI